MDIRSTNNAKLVHYSDSSEDDEADGSSAKRLKQSSPSPALPPLPKSFQDLYSSTVRTSASDDATLHKGRQRVIPHIEGNWPTHVYLEWHPETDQLRILSDILDNETKSVSLQTGTGIVHSLLKNELGVHLPLHVSLSRTLMLKAHQKASYMADLQRTIRQTAVHEFAVSVRDLKWYPNEAESRRFLVLRTNQAGSDELTRLLNACNEIAQKYNQPLLYQERGIRGEQEGLEIDQFHISIAWMLDEPLLPKAMVTSEVNDHLTIRFGEVKARCGQDVTRIPLPPQRTRDMGQKIA